MDTFVDTSEKDRVNAIGNVAVDMAEKFACRESRMIEPQVDIMPTLRLCWKSSHIPPRSSLTLRAYSIHADEHSRETDKLRLIKRLLTLTGECAQQDLILPTAAL
jgi:hypothetical protein